MAMPVLTGRHEAGCLVYSSLPLLIRSKDAVILSRQSVIVGASDAPPHERGRVLPSTHVLSMRCDRANEAFAEAGLTMADIDGLTVAGICETVPTFYGSIRQSRQAAPPALMPWPPSNPTGRVFLYDRQLTPSVVEEQSGSRQAAKAASTPTRPRGGSAVRGRCTLCGLLIRTGKRRARHAEPGDGYVDHSEV